MSNAGSLIIGNPMRERASVVSLLGVNPQDVLPLTEPERPTAGWRLWWDEETSAVWAVGSKGTKTRLDP